MGKKILGFLDILDMFLGVLQSVVGISLYYVFFAVNFNSEKENFENWLVPGYIIIVGFLVFLKTFCTVLTYKYFALLHTHLGLCLFLECIALFQFSYWTSRYYYSDYNDYTWDCWLELISACCFSISANLRFIFNWRCTVNTTETNTV